MQDTVKSHFNAQAANYQSSWQKWPGSHIRRSESQTVLQLLGNINKKAIVEFGSGSGYYTRLLLTAGAQHIHAIDVSQPMLNNLPAGPITPILADANNVCLPQQFDYLLSAGMLEFTPTPSTALTNMAKHATTYATLVLLIPLNNCFGKLYQLYHRLHHINIHLFNLNTFAQLAHQANWQILSIKKCGLFSAAIKLIPNAKHSNH